MFGICAFPAKIRRLFNDRAGGVMTYAALLAPIVIGAAGLSVDVSSWHLHHKVARSAADAAAISGALELLRTGTGQVNATVLAAAQRNGFENGEDTIVINSPPLSGSRGTSSAAAGGESGMGSSAPGDSGASEAASRSRNQPSSASGASVAHGRDGRPS